MSQQKFSNDERLSKISGLLKVADRYVLAGDFDKATTQVEQVFKIDPNNIYGKAYLKRIEVFRKKQHREDDDRTAARADQTDVEKKPEKTPLQKDDNQRQAAEKIKTLPESQNWERDEIGGERAKISPRHDYDDHPQIRKTRTPGKLSKEDERQIVEDIIARESGTLIDLEGADLPVSKTGDDAEEKDGETLQREKNEQKYRRALEAFWKHGSVSDSDREKLFKFREALDISEERHNELERSVKLAAYVNAVKKAWEDGLITPTGAVALEDLRHRFSININEHLMIESRIMYELHGMRARGKIMIIDDDIELAKIIKTILREEGYTPFSANSPEQGLKILERTTPDLILLDITFPKPSISGFTTYERIRSRPNLKFVPVVFLSGLDEEHIVQVGKKLGADDYITKPCSDQMLVSTIEGKIKRYKDLRKSVENNE